MNVARRLDELADEHDLRPGAIELFARLLKVLADDATAPTTVREPERAVDVHIADSLSGLDLTLGAPRIADLGAGAGFPGLALAVAQPESQVALVESSGKKCAFMSRAVDATGLTNAAVVCERAEEWEAGTRQIDLVTARALAPLSVIAEYAAPLLRVGGRLVAWKGARDEAEEAGARTAAGELGLELAEIRPVKPFPDSRHRHLHVYSKVMETPPRFPRRAGIARKRALGGST